jgi:hypothetical protein
LEYSNSNAAAGVQDPAAVLSASFVHPFIAGLDPAIHHAKKVILPG